ncbi:MAG: hypothetical protein KAS07_05095 [Candidatus Pacebacteria bacterium]|nr:hypothetical protein [Candidatus Paceibacterota bacterium]
MKDFTQQRGFIRYIVLFVLLIVFIAMFDIDVKAIVESAFVQEVIHYVKVVLQFIYDAFEKVIGSIKSSDTSVSDMASTTVSTTSPSL